MPAAHFLGLRPGLVLAQHPDDLLLAEATPFHRPSPFQATDSTSFRLSFRGAGQLNHSSKLLVDNVPCKQPPQVSYCCGDQAFVPPDLTEGTSEEWLRHLNQ